MLWLQLSRDEESRSSSPSPQEYPERAVQAGSRLDASSAFEKGSPTTTTSALVNTSTISCLQYPISRELLLAGPDPQKTRCPKENIFSKRLRRTWSHSARTA